MNVARTHPLSLFVHAVDDGGGLCGARPRTKRGWIPVERWPVNCPRCLLGLARPRWSYCETPTASSVSPWHIRRIGPEGFRTGGIGNDARTLCGKGAGWDVMMLDKTTAPVCRSCRAEYARVVARR